MRALALWLVPVALFGAPKYALAVAYPPTALMSGEVTQSVVSNLCYIVRGASEFIRNGSGPRAYITIAEMTGDGYQLNGRANMTFTDSTSGSVVFPSALPYPADIRIINFQGYSQTYNVTTKTLTVQFTLNFPSCNLPVNATFGAL